MQRLGFGLGFVFLVHSFSALADDSNPGSYAVSFGVGSGGGVSIKRVLSDDNQIFVGFSLAKGQYEYQYQGTTSSDSSTHYSVMAGTRHFLVKERLSKFVQLSIAGGRSTGGGDGYSATAKWVSVTPAYGLEYFIASDLSIEGVAGLGFGYSNSSSNSNGVAQGSGTSRYISFPTVGTAITYYW